MTCLFAGLETPHYTLRGAYNVRLHDYLPSTSAGHIWWRSCREGRPRTSESGAMRCHSDKLGEPGAHTCPVCRICGSVRPVRHRCRGTVQCRCVSTVLCIIGRGGRGQGTYCTHTRDCVRRPVLRTPTRKGNGTNTLT